MIEVYLEDKNITVEFEDNTPEDVIRREIERNFYPERFIRRQLQELKGVETRKIFYKEQPKKKIYPEEKLVGEIKPELLALVREKPPKHKTETASYLEIFKSIPSYLVGTALEQLGGIMVALEETPMAQELRRFEQELLKDAPAKLRPQTRDDFISAGRYLAEKGNQIRLANMPVTEEGTFKHFVNIAARTIPYNILLIGLGILTKRPNLTLSLMGMGKAGEKYLEYRRKDVDPKVAFVGASLSGAGESLTEKVPINVLFQTGMPFLSKILKFGAVEFPQEWAMSIIDHAIDKVVAYPDRSFDDLWNDLVETTAVTALSVPILSGFSHTAIRALESKEQREVRIKIQEYKKQGMSENEAIAKALIDIAKTKEGKEQLEKLEEKTLGEISDMVESIKETQEAEIPVAKYEIRDVSIKELIADGWELIEERGTGRIIIYETDPKVRQRLFNENPERWKRDGIEKWEDIPIDDVIRARRQYQIRDPLPEVEKPPIPVEEKPQLPETEKPQIPEIEKPPVIEKPPIQELEKPQVPVADETPIPEAEIHPIPEVKPEETPIPKPIIEEADEKIEPDFTIMSVREPDKFKTVDEVREAFEKGLLIHAGRTLSEINKDKYKPEIWEIFKSAKVVDKGDKIRLIKERVWSNEAQAFLPPEEITFERPEISIKNISQKPGIIFLGKTKKSSASITSTRKILRTLAREDKEFEQNPVFTVTPDRTLIFKAEKRRYEIIPQAISNTLADMINSGEIGIGQTIRLSKGYLDEKRLEIFLVRKGVTAEELAKELPEPLPPLTEQDIGLKETIEDLESKLSEVQKEIETKKSKLSVDSPLRDFETFINTKIDPNVAIPKLVKIAKEIGVTIKITAEGWEDGKFSVRKDKVIRGISVKDIDDFVSLTHEIGHAFDFILGNKEFPKTLSERIKIEFNKKREEALIEELKAVSDFVRPFDRKSASRGFLAYRNKRTELFADWATLYFAMPEKARELAPIFTSGMESHHPQIIDISEELKLPAEALQPHPLPVKKLQNAIKKIIDIFTPVKPLPEVKSFKRKYDALIRAKGKIADIVLLPMWRGVFSKNPAVKNIFRDIQDNISYFYHGELAKGLQELQWKEIHKMPEESKYKIGKALIKGNDKGVEQYFADDELTNIFKFNQAEIDAYNRIVKIVRKAVENTMEYYKVKYGYYDATEEQKIEIERKVKEKVDKLGGYIPIERFGDWFVYGEAEGEVFFGSETNEKEAIKMANMLSEMGYKNVSYYKHSQLPESFWANKHKISLYDLETLVESAGAKTTDENILKLRKYIASQGFDKHFIKRKWTPGFKRDLDNTIQAIEMFYEQSVRRLSKAKAFYASTKHLNEIDHKKEPETYAYMRDYIEGVLNASHGEFQTIRHVIYAYYLAFSPTYLFQQLVQNCFTLYPEIANHVSGLEAERRFLLGQIDAANYLSVRLPQHVLKIVKRETYVPEGKIYRLPDEMVELIDRGINEKLISGAFTEMVLGVTPRRKLLTSTILGSFGASAEMWNRLHASTTAYRIATEVKGLTEKEEIYNFMKEIVEKTAYPYSQANIPNFINKTGNLRAAIRVALTFKMTHLNYLHQLSDIMIHGTFGAKTRAIGTRAFWMGITRILPFGALILYLIRWIFGDDVPTELKKEFGKDNEGLAELLLYGAPVLANMDLTDALDAGTLIHPDFDAANQIFGPGWGIADRIDEAIYLTRIGKFSEAFERASPRALSNLLTALRWKEEGKKIKEHLYFYPSEWEVTQKMLGFTPARLKEMYTLRGVEDYLNKEYDEILKLVDGKLKKLLKTKEGLELLNRVEMAEEEQRTDWATAKKIMGEDFFRIGIHNRKAMEYITILYETLDEEPVAKEKLMNKMYKKYTIEYDDFIRWVRKVKIGKILTEAEKRNLMTDGQESVRIVKE